MPIETVGYSGKPLHIKLGLKEGTRYLLIDEPKHYSQLIRGATGLDVSSRFRSADTVHLFCGDRRSFQERIARALRCTAPGGQLWISWPKKTSTLHVDLVEGDLRAKLLPRGWVDVKVCAVDENWSALKFVRRSSSR